MRKSEASNARIEIRLTAEEKEQIKEAATKRNMTVSDFIRMACQNEFYEEEK